MKFKIIANQQTPKIESLTTENNIYKNRDYKLLTKFLSFARRQHNCVGLAANQVSCDGERIMKPFFAIKDDRWWDIIIQPEILKYHGEKEEKIEGCLTWLGKKIVVKRYPEIDVEYYNLKGEFISKKIFGLAAQIWQHEYNHLMGIEEKFL
jgi:peptide deformylase